MSFTQLTVVPPPEAKNRRAHPRRRPEKLAYLRFDQDNGGILLDICEGGLNFQGVAGLMDGEPCRLRFILPGTTQSIEATGKVAWLNSSRKGGGLRFVNLPKGALVQIREWIAAEPPSGAAIEPLPVETNDALPAASSEARPSRSFSPAQVPAKSESSGRDEPAGRSSDSVFPEVVALLILVFAAVVLVGGSPIDKLATFAKNMRKAGVVAPAASPAVAPAQNFQVEAVDINDRRWILTNGSDALVPPRQETLSPGANFQNAVLVHGVQAQYPPEASAAQVSGAVRVNATIGKDGAPTSLKVISGDSRLAAAALEAIRLWRYRPALLNGQPIESQMVITINF